MKTNRRDVSVDKDGNIHVHPEKMKSLVEDIKCRMEPAAAAALWDSVLDEEMHYFAEQVAVEELAADMRKEIRGRLRADNK